MDDTHFISVTTYSIEEVTSVNKREFGPAIGTFLGKPIYKTIKEEQNQYVFDRLADCDDDGCPLDQLNEGEMMINPGLIYKVAV